MAFISDVTNGLVSSLAATLFPAITYQWGDVQVSAAGPQVRLYPGWPLSSQLDADLANGIAGQAASAFVVNVSVFPASAMARNTTRYLPDWVESAAPIVSSFRATKGTRTVTFAGSYSANTVVGISYGNADAPPKAYAYRLLANDTPTSVATLFASKFSGATASAGTVTFPTDANLACNALVDGQGLMITRMTEQYFRVTVWSPTPALRDAVAGYVDAALSNVRALAMPDGTNTGKLEYRSTFMDDVPEKSREFRADLQFCIEYPTTLLQTFPRLIFGQTNITPNNGSVVNFGVSIIP